MTNETSGFESRGPDAGADAVRRATALAYGVLCHGTFAAAIALTIAALHDGLRAGGPFALHLPRSTALALDALLLLQFPLLHSWLLSGPGRAVLARLAPRAFGKTLTPTTFAIAASLQLLAVFGCWQPSGVTLYAVHGAWRWPLELAFALSWAFLVKALWDAGLGLQTGFVGWSALWRGRSPRWSGFPTRGLFARCRQPVYLAFAATLWSGPNLSLDRLVLALTWSAYCALGPLHKEARYRAWYPAAYAEYCRRVPYFAPRSRRTPPHGS